MTSSEGYPRELPELIAITGRKGSGKDYLARHLEAEHGYLHVSASDVLRQIAREGGFKDPISREVLNKIGNEFKEKFGKSPITTSSLEKYFQEQERYNGLAISGLCRAPEIRA